MPTAGELSHQAERLVTAHAAKSEEHPPRADIAGLWADLTVGLSALDLPTARNVKSLTHPGHDKIGTDKPSDVLRSLQIDEVNERREDVSAGNRLKGGSALRHDELVDPATHSGSSAGKETRRGTAPLPASARASASAPRRTF